MSAGCRGVRGVSQAVMCSTRRDTVRTCDGRCASDALLAAGPPAQAFQQLPYPWTCLPTCVQCGLLPAARVLHPPLTPLSMPRQLHSGGGCLAAVPWGHRSGHRAVVADASCPPYARLSRRWRSPLPLTHPRSHTNEHGTCTRGVRGCGAAVLQPSTTARARSPIVICCSSCSSSAPH